MVTKKNFDNRVKVFTFIILLPFFREKMVFLQKCLLST